MIDDSGYIKSRGNVGPAKEAVLASLIWTIVAVLVILWLLGLGMHIGGSLIFLLLVLAIIGVVYNLLAGGMYGGTRHHHHTTEVTEVEHRDV
jgi:small-conductance mechanosensitive channel